MAGETPKLWSKLESGADVTSPQLGTGGEEISSPTYEAAKFGNGILAENYSHKCKFPTSANSVNMDKGTIEMWIKHKVASGWGGDLDLFDFTDTHGLRFELTKAAAGYSDFELTVTHEGGSFVVKTGFLSFPINTLMHVAVTWDRQGNDIGDGKTVAIYIDNVEEGNSTTTWNESTGIDPYMFMCKEEWAAAEAGVLDNLKTYNLCKTDFSDKEDEDSGAPPPKKPTLVQMTNI